MERVSEKFVINLRIGNLPFPITISRSDEEIYRKSEKMINERLNHYSSRFPGQDDNAYMAMTLLDLALSLKKNESKNDTKPLENCMQNMLRQIEETLKGT